MHEKLFHSTIQTFVIQWNATDYKRMKMFVRIPVFQL